MCFRFADPSNGHSQTQTINHPNRQTDNHTKTQPHKHTNYQSRKHPNVPNKPNASNTTNTTNTPTIPTHTDHTKPTQSTDHTNDRPHKTYKHKHTHAQTRNHVICSMHSVMPPCYIATILTVLQKIVYFARYYSLRCDAIDTVIPCWHVLRLRQSTDWRSLALSRSQLRREARHAGVYGSPEFQGDLPLKRRVICTKWKRYCNDTLAQ